MLEQGGTLDTNELRVALRRLRKNAESASIDEERCEQMAEHWRMRSKQVGEAERCTIEYEQLERSLREVRIMMGKDRAGTRSDGTVRGCLDARLYASMVQRNIGVSEIISKWDADHDGFISRHEFKGGVLKVVPNAAEEEVDDLFDSV